MAVIVKFPAKHSDGYTNMIRLIDLTSSKKVLGLYLDSIEHMRVSGRITDDETDALRDMCRMKLARPEKNHTQKEHYTISHRLLLD